MANNFLQFCPTDTGTNLLTQVEYAAASDRTVGNQPGVASSKLVNKVLRQSAIFTSQIAQVIADYQGGDVLDNGSPSTILAQLKALILPKPTIIRVLTAASGTFNRGYWFTITSGSATTGATYTNNSFTFTVLETVASKTLVSMSGTGAPTASGTLTKSGGTGDTTLTFQAVNLPIYLVAQVIGGGGGGGGGGTIAQAGGGGGGGGGGMAVYKLNAPGATISYICGAFGAGATAGNTGASGGSSSFNGTASASGGTGGTQSGNGFSVQVGTGGIGGGGSTGDINLSGQGGMCGTPGTSTIGDGKGGSGGASALGTGGGAGGVAATGGSYGGGGAGANGQNAVGYNGGPGAIIVTECFQ